jgi:hypothetical protein
MKAALIKISPLVVATNARVDVYCGVAPSSNDYGTMGINWEPAVDRAPELSIETMSPEIDGRVQAGRARFRLNLRAVRQVTAPETLSWRGAPVIILTDDAAQDLGAVPEFDGMITAARLDVETLLLDIEAEVSSALIDKPLLTAEFTGGAGAAGGAAKRGSLKPAGFGSVKNIEPAWYDDTRNIGMIDGYGNTISIDWLGEGLSSLGPRVADYANYAALAAAIDSHAIPLGRWGSCVAEGLVGLGAPPVGIVTVHAVFGANRPGAMMRRWIETHAGVAAGKIDISSFNALDAAVNRAVHYWTDSQITVKSMLEQMAASCNATPLISFQGKIAVTRAFGGATVATLDRSGSVEPRVIDWKSAGNDAPFYKLRARTARPARVLSRDQVNYVDTLADRGLFSPTEIYRAGNIVWLSDGSSWLYTASLPSSGNVPTVGSAYWFRQTPPTIVDFANVVGATRPEDNADVTANNQAASIAGQGDLALLSYVDWQSRVIGGGKPSDNAGTTLNLTDISTAGSVRIVGNSVQWTSTASGWQTAAISAQASVGGWAVSGRVLTNSYAMMGATYLAAPSANYSQLNWAIYNTITAYYIYERDELGVVTANTPNVDATMVPVVGDELLILSNDVIVYYYVRGKLIHMSDKTPTGKRIRAMICLEGGSVSDIQITTMPSAILAAKPSPGQNVLFNGDAEAGTTAGWIINGGLLSGYQFTTSGAAKNSGARSFRMQKPSMAGHNIDALSRAVPVIPGEKYVIDLWLYGNAASTAGGLYVRMWERPSEPATGHIGGGAVAGLQDAYASITDLIGGGTWPLGPQSYKLTYTVPAGVYWASFGLYSYFNGPNDVFFEVAMKKIVDWQSGIDGAGKPENNADVTLLMSPSTKTRKVACDYLGAVKPGQLDAPDIFKLLNAASTDVTTLAAWSATLISGSATFTMGAANGVFQPLTVSSDAFVQILAVYNSKNRYAYISLERDLDAPPAGGGGGGGGGSSYGSLDDATIHGATYGAASGPVLSVAAGSGGQVMVSAATTFRTSGSGYRSTYGKWMWRPVGGSFTDVAAEQGSSADSYRSTISGELEDYAGTLDVAMTKTGLTPGTTYEFQFFYRSASGNVRYLTGTGSAVGS